MVASLQAWHTIPQLCWLPPLGFNNWHKKANIYVDILTSSCFCLIPNIFLACASRGIRWLTLKAQLNYEWEVCWTQEGLPLWFSQVGAQTISTSPYWLYFDSAWVLKCNLYCTLYTHCAQNCTLHTVQCTHTCVPQFSPPRSVTFLMHVTANFCWTSCSALWSAYCTVQAS